jgi:DNA-binding MarR family transcriptional regulator
MSESTRPSQREAATGSSATPRAIIHKKILDLAEERPNTTITELAEIVNGASAELVEHVLEEYGDPAQVSEKDGGDPAEEPPRETGDDSNVKMEQELTDNDLATQERELQEKPAIDPEQIPEKQREILRTIYEKPEKTQKEIAEQFGVSSATICRRINDVEEFEWNNRHEFVERIFGTEKPTESEEMANERFEVEARSDTTEIRKRVQRIEERLEEQPQSRPVFGDPVLVHKVVHACMHSDQISEEEELRILRGLIGDEPNTD